MSRPAVDTLDLRPYRAGDESTILALFPRVFHVGRSLEHWRWKYADNPWGRLAIAVAVTELGDLAAHYAGYPVPWTDARDGLRPLLGLQIGDTMTAPGFRGAGHGPRSLLARLAERYYEVYCRGRAPSDWPLAGPGAAHSPVGWNYGFITGNHRAFSLRFVGARLVESAPYRRRALASGLAPFDPPSLGERLAAALGRGPERYEVDRAIPTDADLDELFARAAPAYGILVRRDAAWIRWRYLACPDGHHRFLAVRRGGRLVGWGVFRANGTSLTWGDALFDRRHPAALRALLTAAVGTFGAQSEVLDGWFSARPRWWARWLDRVGFSPAAEPDDISLVYVPFAAGEATGDLLANAYYTKGDGDLF